MTGFNLFGTRSSVVDHEFDGFSVGYVENLFSYRDEPFFPKFGQQTNIIDHVNGHTNTVDFSIRTSLVPDTNQLLTAFGTDQST